MPDKASGPEQRKKIKMRKGKTLRDRLAAKHAKMPPDGSPEHEAMESAEEEMAEHATGVEAQDEPKKGKRPPFPAR
ncbi:MAG TPA: hypothetical protein VKD22_10955 [Ramlibacter sp.]|nr:hypothetical protein [Ramlibacter sp.]